MTSVRLAHSRFLENSPAERKDLFDRVVSSAWTYDPKTSILTYGATVYRKAGKSDFWNKQMHKDTALERFTDSPLRIFLNNTHYCPKLSSSAIDWFIARNLIFKFGTHNKNERSSGNFDFEIYIYSDFNIDNDPYYVTQQQEVKVGSSNSTCNICYLGACFILTLFCTATLLHVLQQ